MYTLIIAPSWVVNKSTWPKDGGPSLPILRLDFDKDLGEIVSMSPERWQQILEDMKEAFDNHIRYN